MIAASGLAHGQPRGQRWRGCGFVLDPAVASFSRMSYDAAWAIGWACCTSYSEQEYQMFDRIVSDPAILGGKPIIRGTRISVEMVMEWIASGASRDDILGSYSHLCAEDVQQAIGYAAHAVENEVLATAEIKS